MLYITTQKSTHLTYIVAEAWDHAQYYRSYFRVVQNTLKMKVGSFSEMPATNFQLTWCHDREDFDLHQRCCENLRITYFWEVHWKQPGILSLYCTYFLHPNFLSILDNLCYDLQLCSIICGNIKEPYNSPCKIL